MAKMTLNQMQLVIFHNKVKRGFNTTDIRDEIICLVEELGELARAFRDSNKKLAPEVDNRNAMADAIGDTMVYCLGLCQMLGIDSEELLVRTIDDNHTRTHRSHMADSP